MSKHLKVFQWISALFLTIFLSQGAKAHNLELTFIKGGTFQMGSPARLAEQPIHAVFITDFKLMTHEVAVSEFNACVNQGICQPAFVGPWCNEGQVGRDQHPVNCVTWRQSETFCRWAGLRLPSEAEWEYAARSRGQNYKFPWGNRNGSCSDAVGYDAGFGCGQDRTWDVCSKPSGSTSQGLCDMGGNVWEWTADDAHDDYQGAPSHSKPWVDEPRSEGRIYRGGGFMNFIPAMLTTYRRFSDADTAEYEVGFRCAE